MADLKGTLEKLREFEAIRLALLVAGLAVGCIGLALFVILKLIA